MSDFRMEVEPTDLRRIADQLGRIADALERLGLNEAATPLGALELVALEIKEGLADLTHAVRGGGQ